MKKSFLWMLTAIMTCGLTMTTLTSCSDDDNDIHVDQTLSGDWFLELEDDSDDERVVKYLLLTFGDDGVSTSRTYEIYPDEPAYHSERMRRHVIYQVNETDGSITMKYKDHDDISHYVFNKDGISILSDDATTSYQLHRPTDGDLKLLDAYDHMISSDDYVGEWIHVSEENGVSTYTVLDIDDDGQFTTTRYTLQDDVCTSITTTQWYGEYDTKDFRGQVLELHNPTDFNETTLYWWTVKKNQLTLGLADEDEEYEDEGDTYRPLTAADETLIEELDRMVN